MKRDMRARLRTLTPTQLFDLRVQAVCRSRTRIADLAGAELESRIEDAKEREPQIVWPERYDGPNLFAYGPDVARLEEAP